MADDPYAALIPSKPKDDDPYAALIPKSADVAPATAGGPARITVRPPGAEPQTTATEAFGRGAAGAGSYGFADELAGVAAAGGMNMQPTPQEFADSPATMNPLALHLRTFGNILRGGGLLAVGDQEAAQRRDAEIARQRELNKVSAEEHPIASTAGAVTGAVISPINYTPTGPGVGAGALAAARTGAVQGGLTGLGEGEGSLGERLPGAVEGAGLGAAIGGVAAPVIRGVGWGVRQILGPTLNIARGLRGLPATEEAKRFVDVTSRDVAAGDVGLSGAQADLARARGQPVMAIDQFGTNTRALSRAAADASPEARGLMEGQLRERFETQAPRMADFLRGMSNHADDVELADAVRSVGSLQNTPLYRRAYAAGDRPIWSPELERLTSSPDVADAVRGAMTRWRSFQVRDGYGGMNPPFQVTPDGRLEFFNSRGAPVFPNIQLWDYAGRTLSGMAERARASGDRTNAALFGDLERNLKSELDRLVPEFGQARASARQFFGATNALDFGRDFFGSSAKNNFRERLAAFERLTPQQREIAQDGYLPAFVDKVQSAADKQNLLNKIKTSPSFRNEMQTMLGMQRAAQIEDWMRVETLMEQSRTAVSGGSQTSRLLQDAMRYASPIGVGSAGAGAGAFVSGDYDPRNPVALVSGVLAGIGTKRYNAANAAVMRQLSERLMSGNPAEYNRALQTITAMPALRRALHDATDALTPGTGALGRVSGTYAGERQAP